MPDGEGHPHRTILIRPNRDSTIDRVTPRYVTVHVPFDNPSPSAVGVMSTLRDGPVRVTLRVAGPGSLHQGTVSPRSTSPMVRLSGLR